MVDPGSQGGEMPISLESIKAAAASINPYIHRTPILTNSAISALAGEGRKLFFKVPKVVLVAVVLPLQPVLLVTLLDFLPPSFSPESSPP